ncbi:hypothetical protein M514_04306 [Trichuris suis]|uniref:Transmembrane protein n=1 Tax=Trichuris suis TaxID=68888 RepID=A0A085NQK1_9BILA|nr:hypothetical protein M513_04306 [Trichuris suis]KFD71747.1 hypothetical protein M514_04306 [Trichuris suis]KHJ45991.1 hypothetical protein D918_03654 [Trichuris suis]
MPLLSLTEIIRVLGVTVFELWMQLAGALMFSVLLVLKMELGLPWSWCTVFSPLFVVSVLNAFFTLIVFLRQYFGEESVKLAAFRLITVGLLVGLTATTQMVICLRLEFGSSLSHAVTLCPVYVLLFVLLFRSCLLQCA